MMQHPPNQRPFGMPVAQNRGPGGLMGDDNKARGLTQQERQQITESCNKTYATLTDAQKAQIRLRMQQTTPSQALSAYESMGRDLAMVFVEQQTTHQLKNQQNQQRLLLQQQQQQHQQQQQQPNALQQTPQLGQMGHMPTMMNTPTPQQQMAAGQLFPQNLGQMRSQQEMIRPQQMGAAGRNPTPSPINGLPGQVPPNGQPGLGVMPRSQQQFMQQPVKLDPTVPQMVQGISRPVMPGQPGGLVGASPASQGPTPLNRLTSAMSQPPVAMGQNGPGVQQMAGSLNPNFTNPPNHRQTANPAMVSFYNSLSEEARQGMTEQKLRDMFASLATRSGLQNPKLPQAPAMMGAMGQPQPGTTAPFPMAAQPPQPGVGAPVNIQAMEKQRQNWLMAYNNPKVRNVMESLDVPQVILDQYRHIIPSEVRKWGEFKAHLQANGIQLNKNFPLTQLKQFMDYQGHMRAAAMPGGPQSANPQSANPQNANVPPQTAPVPRLPPHIEVPPVTQQDIDAIRQKHPKGMQFSEEEVLRVATQLKGEQFAKMWRQQHAMNPSLGEQKPPVPASAPAMAQTAAAPIPSVAQPRQPAPQKLAGSAGPDSSAPPSATLKNARPPSQNRAAPNPLPAPPPRNLKRPSPDEADDLQEQPTQVAAPVARPPARPRPPPLSAEQIAALTPEQRAKYEQVRQEQVLQAVAVKASPAEVAHLRKIAEEEKVAHLQERQNPSQATIPMSPEDVQEVQAKIVHAIAKIGRLSRFVIALYHGTRDEQAIRAYVFRAVRPPCPRELIYADTITALQARPPVHERQ
jgi:hypothetical protein